MRSLFVALSLCTTLVAADNVVPSTAPQASSPAVAPTSATIATADSAATVSQAEMQAVFDEVKTPYKYGMILPGTNEEYADCANVFRFRDRWYMVYVRIRNKVGYETCLAESTDLLHWTPNGVILPFSGKGWDGRQADGGIALFDTTWGGSNTIKAFKGRYWLSYFGGNKEGYEPDPLSIGMASTLDPSSSEPWVRHESNPVMTPMAADARPFEQETLYKSFIMHDPTESLGYPFLMYYNGKQKGKWIERIGLAYSRDLVTWVRPASEGPVIDNLKGISGDPQITRIGDLWVMFYFGAGWKKGAFDTFACSRDLRTWTKWEGPLLLQASEPYDKVFAHKPWIIKHEGVVYHFYCAVSKEGRGLALATSRDLRPTAPVPEAPGLSLPIPSDPSQASPLSP